jgi:hypothetical protein
VFRKPPLGVQTADTECPPSPCPWGDPVHLLVERLPVRRDLALDASEGHRPVTDEIVQLFSSLSLTWKPGALPGRVASSG